MPAPFVHLHNHTHYSLLQALPKVRDAVRRAKELGMTALAITDYGAVYGAIEFYKECLKQEIKPIIGVEAYLAQNRMTDRRPRIDDRPHNLVLLAENEVGYRNILKMTTAAHLEGFYYKPRIDKELLGRHAQGVICLSGGLRGDICKSLEMNDWERAERLAAEYESIMGKGNFFLELVDHPEMDEQVARNRDLIELGKRLDIPVVATKDVHYLNPEDSEPHDLLICIGAGKTVDQDDRHRMTGVDYSFVDGDHMARAFADCPEAVENTVRIAERCDLRLDLGKWNFPRFDIPEGHDPSSYLRELAYGGLESKRGRKLTEDETERLDYELGILDQKGYSKYFLVVADYMIWARRQGIVSHTRGSAAGSLVGYAVGIVSIDPLFFKLPFERFLNPFRPSPPDVDADFADDRRDEVIAYVTGKYGHDHVAQIGTFGTMAARGAVRDVGRALGYPLGFVDRIAKTIPMGSQGFAMTIARALEECNELKEMSDDDPQVARLLELAQKIEGCARHVSVHAAGVVIADRPLTEYMALQREAGGEKLITQFDMHAVEDAGVLKMDFLGIRNLSILGKAVDMVRGTKGVDIDLVSLPYDDARTYEMLARGETMGVFQFASSGMTKYLTELRPTTIFDLAAMVALYRPGPIANIPEYIRRKHDPSLIVPIDPRMEDLLKASLGMLIYQEDIMMSAITLAGYNWDEADKFRKAMGKKIPAEMAKQEPKFKDGCVAGGLSRKRADELWELIVPFAAYGFNKSHSASYAVVSYWTGYMKANYTAEYMAALMTCESGDIETVADAVQECVRLGIAVLPPDVNSSLAEFTYIDDRTIRFGLKAIKNLGSDSIAEILDERNKNGPFGSIAELAGRVSTKGFNKRALESLIKAGAMDSLGERNRMLASMDAILAYHRKARHDAESGQSSIFGQGALDVPKAELSMREVPPATKRERLAWEKELLGLYVSEHPFKDYSEFFGRLLTPLKRVKEVSFRQPGLLRVGGYITNVHEITTKKGDQMAFCRLEDMSGPSEMVVFPRSYKEYREIIAQEGAVIAEVKYQDREGEDSLLLERLYPIDPETSAELRDRLAMYSPDGAPPSGGDAMAHEAEIVRIAVPATMTKVFAEEMKRVLAEHPGNRRVVLVTQEPDGTEKSIDTSFRIAFSGDFIREVEGVVGRGAVLGG
ncbi:DNA polymerase III subunit alpha [Candidatus Uhrbacteria bacterium]|nr:DNA polymerase III subunit alpha [Candidatus Uhrbacteria bacterium]